MWKLDVEQEMEDPSRIYLYPNAIEIVSSHLKKSLVSVIQSLFNAPFSDLSSLCPEVPL